MKRKLRALCPFLKLTLELCFWWAAAALRKIIGYWELGRFLNITVDPCTPNASWAPENANPRIACDCSTASNTCHITHLSVSSDSRRFLISPRSYDFYDVYCVYWFRKVYALDIVGEIPTELLALKELVDLWETILIGLSRFNKEFFCSDCSMKMWRCNNFFPELFFAFSLQ